MDKVNLISYSQNNKETSLEDLICYCARVSNPTNQNLNLNNQKLLKYLMDNGHWSPFEMVSICLEINTTRDIARQLLRHRSFSFQEFSQRYAKISSEFMIREARLQDLKDRQNSLPNKDENLNSEWIDIQNDILTRSKNAYHWAIENNIAKEVARVILPEGMTSSKLYMNGTLRSWIHYIHLRSGNGTQKEHKEIAIECAKVISKIYPFIIDFIV